MQHLSEKFDVRPILTRPELADEQYLLDIGWTKRLLERFTSDPTFRQKLHDAPQETVEEYGIEVDPEELRPLWDDKDSQKANEPHSRRVARYRGWNAEKRAHRARIREEGYQVTPRYALWRRRHANRATSELGVVKADGLVHATCCFELAKGCSVGCWFVVWQLPNWAACSRPHRRIGKCGGAL